MLLSRRPKNVVPKRRADAVSDVIILVMMAEMVLLQPEPQTPLHGEVVRREMEHVITDVTKNQSGKHARRQAPENQKEEPKKKKRKGDADAWGHHEPT